MSGLLTKQHIAIVGGGIGGLAVAHSLHQHGFSITLLEQASQWSEIGSGIGIWENGLEALDVIGLRQAVEARGLSWPHYEIYRSGKKALLKDNRVLSRDGNTAPLMIKRGALFGVLKEALPSDIKVLTGFKVKNISGRVILSEDGREFSADIIIGADGAHSIVRQQLTDDTLKFRRQICFRGIASGVSNEAWNAAEIYDEQAHRVGYFRLPNNEVYWFDIVDSEASSGEFAAVKGGLKALSPRLADIIDKTPASDILCHPISDMPPVMTPHDYIALIGDAAHPLQPSLGQGACLALEDAVVLADCLAMNAHAPEVAIKAYLSKRKKRWSLYYKLCQQLGTGALDKGLFGRRLAIFRMVHTPQWSLSMFGRRIFAFKR